jgi:hypothetical protein
MDLSIGNKSFFLKPKVSNILSILCSPKFKESNIAIGMLVGYIIDNIQKFFIFSETYYMIFDYFIIRESLELEIQRLFLDNK